MESLFNLQPAPAPHKTKRFWALIGLILVAVLCGTLVQRSVGLSLHAQIISGISTLAAGISASWFGVRFGSVGWLILALLMVAFIVWAAFYTSHMRHSEPNQSMKPTAPLQNKFSVFATTPCRGLSLSRSDTPLIRGRCSFAKKVSQKRKSVPQNLRICDDTCE